jgi:O-antigen ligase
VLVLFVVPMLLREARDLRLLGWVVVVAALVGAAMGRLLGHGFGDRAVGMFSDPNEFAAATVVAAAFALALGESSQHRTVRWFGRIATCMCLVAIVSSQSRTGVLGVGVALAILLVTARGVVRVRLAGYTAVGNAAVLAWIMLSPTGLAAEQRLSGEDSTGRTDLWRVARYQFEDEPVHGVGLGNYPVVSIRYLRGDVKNLDLFIRMPRTVHNTPLELLAELGVVGFGAFYLVVAGCFVTLVRALRRARAIRDAALVGACRGILAGLAALILASLTLSAIYVELQWILFGASIAAASIARRSLTPHERDVAMASDDELAWAGILDVVEQPPPMLRAP